MFAGESLEAAAGRSVGDVSRFAIIDDDDRLLCATSSGSVFVSPIASWPTTRSTVIADDFAMANVFTACSSSASPSVPFGVRHCVLVTSGASSSPREVVIWDVTSPFAAHHLRSISVQDLAHGAEPSAIAAYPATDDLAVGFSNGLVVVLHDAVQTLGVHVHARPVSIVALCSVLGRVAAVDTGMTVSLIDARTSQVLFLHGFAGEMLRVGAIHFCQIENVSSTGDIASDGTPLRPVLLVGLSSNLVVAVDANEGVPLNASLESIAGVAGHNDQDDDTDGLSSRSDTTTGNREPALVVAGVVDLEGNPIPCVRTDDKSRSIYISPRYIVTACGSSLDVRQIGRHGPRWECETIAHVSLPDPIVSCFIISQPMENKSSASCVALVLACRCLQIRRLMDLSTVLLEADLPGDIPDDELAACCVTSDGRLTWRSSSGEVVTAMLFMDALRRIQAPVVSTGTTAAGSSNVDAKHSNFLASISKAIKGSSVCDLFAETRPPPPAAAQARQATRGSDADAFSSMTSKARENLEALQETADKSQNLASAANDFAANARRLAAKQRSGWF
ncbi:hypothetical protein PBRA_008159 [Plasmodiophora brassicae]|nr:hypothetical protein PBRA_008159 [Plasmodiophora brassicae]